MRSRGAASKNSYVDETLFGGKTGGAGSNKNKIVTSTGLITVDELRTIRQKTEKNN